jgi:hypothetical protein
MTSPNTLYDAIRLGEIELSVRLWSRIEKTDSCWNWMGCCDGRGYGAIRVGGNDGRTLKVHIIVYEQRHGAVPKGLELDHLCRNRKCCNPDHLEAVTHAENVRRGTCADYQRVKTHCRQGHLYDEANTYIYRGGRHCRACNLIYTYRRRNKAKPHPSSLIGR